MRTIILTTVLIALWAGTAWAHPEYIPQIPSTYGSWGLEKGCPTCHADENNPSALNPFGEDVALFSVAANGFDSFFIDWGFGYIVPPAGETYCASPGNSNLAADTGNLKPCLTLCEVDSDNDGYSNGVELGDPFCYGFQTNFFINDGYDVPVLVMLDELYAQADPKPLWWGNPDVVSHPGEPDLQPSPNLPDAVAPEWKVSFAGETINEPIVELGEGDFSFYLWPNTHTEWWNFNFEMWEDLPAGLSMDPETGLVTGVVQKEATAGVDQHWITVFIKDESTKRWRMERFVWWVWPSVCGPSYAPSLPCDLFDPNVENRRPPGNSRALQGARRGDNNGRRNEGRGGRRSLSEDPVREPSR